MATKQEKINAVLDELRRATSDIQGLGVISPDGMMIADKLGGNQGDAAAAMGAALGSLAKRVTDTLKVGDFQEVNIRGVNAGILLFDIEHRAAMIVTVSSGANLGLVFLEARQAQNQLAQII
jgi:predicted regulator of Ras-like GTPase activity (Roadblock/LC7/MglB family)